ncbi:hypothetical protein GCM10007103_09660 [Salinimicrobium marinum]|uniref:PglD N-terminal domain-containing protein n=1 Tax=Salinimicrobium marinum TaxID=680283 RepID=A0A918S9G8_9FLAO|nr:acetyltransferase [Salinimicrobium marinum]GHA30367.1 hypothetical protein GCM10007103_09660 [Salinimicrobium marinum]
MKKKLIIYGVGKYAEYAAYVFENDSEFDVEAFCMEKAYLDTSLLMGKPILEFEEVENTYSSDLYSIFIAVGNNQTRKKIFDAVSAKGFGFASYISSKARTWDNLIVGKNTFIDEGCVLQPFTKIGDNAILFTSDIGHHTIIGNTSLLSGCKTGGNVNIGENCYIGLNASIQQNITLGKNNIIGMGCVIETDTLEGSVFTNKGTKRRSTTYDQVAGRFLK